MWYRITIERVPGYAKTREDFLLNCDNDVDIYHQAIQIALLWKTSAIVSVKLLEELRHG